MTGILEQWNTNSSWELFFPPCFQPFLPQPELAARTAPTPQHRWRKFSHPLTVWVKCHGRLLTWNVCMCVRMRACVSILSLCVQALAFALLFSQRKERSGTKRCSEPKRHALWQPLATSCVDWVDLKCHTNMSYKLQVSLYKYTPTHKRTGERTLVWPYSSLSNIL